MTFRSCSPLRAGAAGLALVALALLSLPACEGDGGGAATADADAAEGPDAGDVGPIPDFSVSITASTLSGNAPLTVDFEATVSGDLSLEDVTIRWFVDGEAQGDGPTVTIPFYRAGAATVAVEARWSDASGQSKVERDSVVVRVQGCADLTFDRLTLEPPVEIAPGDVMTLRSARLFNDGDTIEGAFDVLLVLSVDDVFDPDDIIVERWTVEGMGSGLFGDVFIDYAGHTATVGEDVPEGFYYVFLVADPDNVVNECQETNNVEAYTNNLTVEVSAGLKPDLVLLDPAFPSGLTVTAGDTINFSYRIANRGLGEATLFRVAFWLSPEPFATDAMIPVIAAESEAAKINSLLPDVEIPFFRSYKIPADLPDGNYWLVGVVDALDQVNEANEDNNSAVSAEPLVMQYVEPTCFDMAFTSVQVEPLSTYWDGSVQLTVTVENSGTVPTPDDWPMRAFLSLQQSLNPTTARVVGNWLNPSIPPGESRTLSHIIAIDDDLPVQPHYVGAIIDPDNLLEECVESNNAIQNPQPITINAVASVDVSVGPIVYHPSTVTAGEVIKLEYTLANGGTSGATAFEVGFVLSPDATVTRNAINSGGDILIGRAMVSSVPANGEVARVDEVVVPVALDHTVESYYVAVVADIDRIIGQDEVASNNIRVADQILTVVGAQGGCYEDTAEDNDSLGAASPITPGTIAGLGSCGDEDWYTVDVPAGHSLWVDVIATPILSLRDVPGELVAELRDAAGALVDQGDSAGGPAHLRAFAVAEAGVYSVRVAGRTPASRASYDLVVDVRPPADGVDLLGDDVVVSPSALYPGGLVNVGWREVNVGTMPAGGHKVRVWASTDETLDLAVDVAVAEVDVPGVPALGAVEGAVDALLPSALAGGDWYLLVQVDADDDLVEVDEGDNVAWGGPIVLDATHVCADDDLEPNDEPRIATPLTLVDGEASLADRVICPGLPDWYAVELAAGQSLVASVAYDHDPGAGLVQIELWDPSRRGRLLSQATSGVPSVELPWAWLPGTYYLGVSNKAQSGKEAPYTYSLDVTVGDGAEDDACVADSYEDDNSFARAKPAGCGVLSATLCKADVDYYVLEAQAGVEVRLSMQHPSSETRLRLYEDPEGSPVKTRTGNGTLTHLAQQDGPLWVVVEPRNGPLSMTSFDYDLTIEGIAGIDLSVDGPTLQSGQVTAGEDVRVDFSVVNGCTEDAAPFDVTIWLSVDPFLDADDAPIASVAVSQGLQAGEAVPISRKVTIPASTLEGEYFLLVEADASGEVPESNEQNNVSAAAVAVRAPCLPDAYEPNDFLLSPSDAPDLTPPGATGLRICAFDQDWFEVAAPGGVTMTVTAHFAHADGDLDLRLYDTAYSTALPVASSTSNDDDEQIVYEVPVATTFLVRVAGFEGATNDYELELSFE